MALARARAAASPGRPSGRLPPQARETFRAAYGEIDGETWALARLRGLHLGAALAVYAAHMGDAPLLREALLSIDFTRTS